MQGEGKPLPSKTYLIAASKMKKKIREVGGV
jgi:hypothetical protein